VRAGAPATAREDVGVAKKNRGARDEASGNGTRHAQKAIPFTTNRKTENVPPDRPVEPVDA